MHAWQQNQHEPSHHARRFAPGRSTVLGSAALVSRDGAGAGNRAGGVPAIAAVMASLKELVESGAVVLADDADVRGLADRLLAHLETVETTDVGGAVGEWLLEQEEIEELYADDGRIEATLRRALAGQSSAKP